MVLECWTMHDKKDDKYVFCKGGRVDAKKEKKEKKAKKSKKVKKKKKLVLKESPQPPERKDLYVPYGYASVAEWKKNQIAFTNDEDLYVPYGYSSVEEWKKAQIR